MGLYRLWAWGNASAESPTAVGNGAGGAWRASSAVRGAWGSGIARALTLAPRPVSANGSHSHICHRRSRLLRAAQLSR
jgi:hypothetical protein